MQLGLESGVNKGDIMQQTGHRSVQSYRGYRAGGDGLSRVAKSYTQAMGRGVSVASHGAGDAAVGHDGGIEIDESLELLLRRRLVGSLMAVDLDVEGDWDDVVDLDDEVNVNDEESGAGVEELAPQVGLVMGDFVPEIGHISEEGRLRCARVRSVLGEVGATHEEGLLEDTEFFLEAIVGFRVVRGQIQSECAWTG